EQTVLDVLEAFANAGARAALGAMLHDAIGIFHRGDELMSFPPAMRARLFDIRVLAGLHGPDAHQRMPVVRRRDGDSVDGGIFQQLADVAVRFGLGHAELFDIAEALAHDVLVDVADGGDFDAGDIAKGLDVIEPASAQADDREANAVVCTEDARLHRDCRAHACLHEIATVDFHDEILSYKTFSRPSRDSRVLSTLFPSARR